MILDSFWDSFLKKTFWRPRRIRVIFRSPTSVIKVLVWYSSNANPYTRWPFSIDITKPIHRKEPNYTATRRTGLYWYGDWCNTREQTRQSTDRNSDLHFDSSLIALTANRADLFVPHLHTLFIIPCTIHKTIVRDAINHSKSEYNCLINVSILSTIVKLSLNATRNRNAGR